MDIAHPHVEAPAVKDGHIVALGENHAIRDLANGVNDGPEDGRLVRDADGRVTDLLYEKATHWLSERMPELPDNTYAEDVLFG